MKAFIQAYDYVNLGDDLFVRFLTNRYQNIQFYMLSRKRNQDVFGEIENLKVIDENNCFVRILNKIRPSLVARYYAHIRKRCACSIYIGGSIFPEYTNGNEVVQSWDYYVKKYDYYVLGANFGPYQTDAYVVGMKRIFAQMKDICFRDQYSYELFKNCSKARLAPDILFAQSFPAQKENKKQIFVSIINCKYDGYDFSAIAETYEDWISDMIADYLKNGYEVKLASFCRANGDEAVCEDIKNKLSELENSGKLTLLFYNGRNTEEILQEIVDSEYVVGTRFHATVLGLAAGKQVLPVIYSDKTKNMLSDIGFDGKSIDIRENFSPIGLTDLKNYAKSVDTAKLGTEALRHFEKLDEFFK